MTYITTASKIAKHEKTDRDIYYDCLEEAYGNLPVPADDFSDIFSLLATVPSDEATPLKDELEDAIEIIRLHYYHVAKALGKDQKYS